MSKVKKAIRFAEYSFSIFLILIVGFAGMGYVTGSTPYYVVSDYPSSMSPTINYGGLVLIYKAPFDGLAKGDIIVFNAPGVPTTVVHRIAQVLPGCSESSPCYETKGDNNATNPNIDPWNVTSQNYLGKVVFIVPYLGYLAPSLWKSDGLLGYSPLLFLVAASGFIYLLTQKPKTKTSGTIQPK